MSAAPKFPWPLPDPKPDAKPDLKQLPKHDPNAESCARFEKPPIAIAEPVLESTAPGNNLTSDPDAPQLTRQAERLESVGRLAGGVAHDFNNLLTGVLLYCDLLLALPPQPDKRVRKYAEEIRNAGTQATGLVRQLLAVARPPNCDPQLLSLNDVAEGMRNLLVRLIGENIELRFLLDPSLGLVKMDPTQAQQILLNLALNARDALPRGGQISVQTSNCLLQIVTEQIISDRMGIDPVPGGQVLSDPGSGAGRAASLPCVLFVVEDNGSGMDAATRSHAFEAFFTTKPTGKGTGLGLATVHDIVTANGGLIHVDSATARGTRVTVLLPLIPQTTFNSRREIAPETNEGVLPATPTKQQKGIMP